MVIAMTTDPRKAKDIFIELVGTVPSDEWDARLDQACAGNDELRHRVRALLRAHAEPGSFLEQPAIADDATVNHEPPIAERPGTVIGPYKLLQQIGEGGMGIVFMAEQTEPIQRTVALKIIKPGMDTRQVIARFEAERQALAMMDHPNIARVLDAGTTAEGDRGQGTGDREEKRASALSPDPPPLSPHTSPDPCLLSPHAGRPYFVMELVKGVPITRYCDDKHLPLPARLELFVQVCQAVQHAHQKGIIHRDIKPNNVLVAEYDNHAVPKVIDFGVAKATAQRLTERTMFTEFGQVLGTMEYMSPEQSKFNQLDIDTRSDIYSLGVLLYELLAGSTPFEGKRLHEAAFDEMLRIIREEEPQKPSTRLTTTDALPSIAVNRHTEPARLSKEVQGELDWIVMKALEKDRNRRYETASSFAADIERHLHDEPVEAGPPSAAYRFRKFARRNKAALATAILVSLAALVAVGSIGWALRDRAALVEQFALERAARQAKVSGQLEVILDEVAKLEQAEKWSEALVSARRAEPALAAGEAPPDIQERVRQTLADLELVRRIEEIRAQSGTVWVTDTALRLAAQAEQDYTAAFRKAGIDVDTLPVIEVAHRITARQTVAAALLPALDDWVAVRSLGQNASGARRLTDVLRIADPDPWRRQVRDILARKDWPALDKLVTSADLDRQPAATLCFLAAALQWTDKHNLAIDVLRQAQWKYPADYWINHRLGVNLIYLPSPHHVPEGIGFMRVAVALRPQSGHSVMNLGNGHSRLGEYDQAITCYRKAIELDGSGYNNLGNALVQKGAYDDAIAAFEQAIKLAHNKPHALAILNCNQLAWILCTRPEAHLRDPRRAIELARQCVKAEPTNAHYWNTLGVALYRANEYEEAIAALEKYRELRTDDVEWSNPFYLAMAHWQIGYKQEARRWLQLAIQWMEKNAPDSQAGYQDEARKLIQDRQGISEEETENQEKTN